jgi:glycosyltransferase involved in cell wall biosynthesis
MIRKTLRLFYHKAKLEEARNRYSYTQRFNPKKTITQIRPNSSSSKIAFLLPGLPAFSGGITSVLRLGTYLQEFGHQVTYIDCSNMPISVSEQNAMTSFSGFKGNIVTLSSLTEQYDIGVCTLWDTAYYLHEYDAHFAYKMYFIQDFEPSFYPLGDLHFMCRRSYQFGFHMVTFGSWNKTKIEADFPGLAVDSITFPVELKVYELRAKQIEIKNRLDIAIFIKLEPKRAPDLITQCLIRLNQTLREKGIELHCWIFGTEISFGLPFAKSLGMLKHTALKELYNRCHMGMVASFTNISNVTFEMMSSGLPTIDFSEGSAPAFFQNNEIVLVDSNPSAFCETITYYIDNQDKLNEILNRSQKAIANRSWQNSAREFNEILNNLK